MALLHQSFVKASAAKDFHHRGADGGVSQFPSLFSPLTKSDYVKDKSGYIKDKIPVYRFGEIITKFLKTD